MTYDALLVMSFGGPEKPEDVMPFLRNVAGGRAIPEKRLAAVAEHYLDFGGRSPLNDQNRLLIGALRQLMSEQPPRLPIYFGNRNWHPFISDTLSQMRADGVRRALMFVTSAFSSYSGCGQYLEDVARARDRIGPGAPQVDKLRVFYNHPGFLEAVAERTLEALAAWPLERRNEVHLTFTAHSIPLSMARAGDYETQLEEAARLVVGLVRPHAPAAVRDNWRLVYQSRSGSPDTPWLEPDILDHLDELSRSGVRDVVVVPLGFLSDHMEVLYDLDREARERADALGITMARAGTVGTHPQFVAMIQELVAERLDGRVERRYLGTRGPEPDGCSPTCCGTGGEARAWKSSSLA